MIKKIWNHMKQLTAFLSTSSVPGGGAFRKRRPKHRRPLLELEWNSDSKEESDLVKNLSYNNNLVHHQGKTTIYSEN